MSSPQANQGTMPKLTDLSFADTEPLKKLNNCSSSGLNTDLLQFQSKSSVGYDSLNSKN